MPAHASKLLLDYNNESTKFNETSCWILTQSSRFCRRFDQHLLQSVTAVLDKCVNKATQRNAPACRLYRGEHLWWSLRFVRGYGVTQWCVWCIIIPLPRDTWANERLGSGTKWIRLSIVCVERWNSYKCPKPRCDLRQRSQGRYRVKQKSEKRLAANVLKWDWNTQLWKSESTKTRAHFQGKPLSDAPLNLQCYMQSVFYVST